MIRNLRTMGLALVAVLAMGALFGSVASAQFETEREHTTTVRSTSETQVIQLTSGGLELRCGTVDTHNTILTINKKVTTYTFSANFTNCEQILGATTTVTTAGCSYLSHLSAGSTTGTTDIQCEGTKGIEIIVGSICRYKIGAQTGLNSVSYSNVGSGSTREIRVEPNISGIVSTRTTNDLFCPSAGTTGTYKGSFTITGETEAGEHVGIWVD